MEKQSPETKLFVVHLYGLYNPERRDYATYLDWVASQAKLYLPTHIILCGGYTDPENPEVSEALSAKQYLGQQVENVTWLLEEKSFTTYQNTFNAAEIIAQNNLIPNSIIVLADHARQAKVIWLALTLLLRLDKTEAYQRIVTHFSQANYDEPFNCDKLTVPTFAYQPKLSIGAIRHTYSTLIDALPVYDDSLDAIALQQRRQDFGFDA